MNQCSLLISLSLQASQSYTGVRRLGGLAHARGNLEIRITAASMQGRMLASFVCKRFMVLTGVRHSVSKGSTTFFKSRQGRSQDIEDCR
jgi:hypothetical protein